MAQEFYTVKQLASVLHVSAITVWRKIKSGEIPAVRLGKRILIPGAYFEELKNKALQSTGAA